MQLNEQQLSQLSRVKYMAFGQIEHDHCINLVFNSFIDYRIFLLRPIFKKYMHIIDHSELEDSGLF